MQSLARTLQRGWARTSLLPPAFLTPCARQLFTPLLAMVEWPAPVSHGQALMLSHVVHGVSSISPLECPITGVRPRRRYYDVRLFCVTRLAAARQQIDAARCLPERCSPRSKPAKWPGIAVEQRIEATPIARPPAANGFIVEPGSNTVPTALPSRFDRYLNRRIRTIPVFVQRYAADLQDAQACRPDGCRRWITSIPLSLSMVAISSCIRQQILQA